MLNMASLGVSLVTARNERRHHLESKALELKHHKVALDLEKEHHRASLDLERKQHALEKKAIEADKRYHEQTVKLEKKLHEQSLFSTLEQHLQDITSDLIVAGKEADRDMWDQRNAQYQTLLLSATVMFAAGMAVIVEGELPESSGTVVIIGFSASVGTSFACLFVSIILSIRIIVWMSRFMYKLTNAHQEVVTNLVVSAAKLMDQLFKMQSNDDPIPGDRSSSRPKNEADYQKLLHRMKRSRHEIHKQITNHYFNIRLKNEDRLKKYPKYFGTRRGLHDRREDRTMRPRSCVTHDTVTTSVPDRSRSDCEEVSSMTEFEAFWHENLKVPARIAMLSFYVGTASLLAGISFLIFARFTITLKSPAGACTFVAFVVVSLLLGFFVACWSSNQEKRTKRQVQITQADTNPAGAGWESKGESKGDDTKTDPFHFYRDYRSPPPPARMDTGLQGFQDDEKAR